MNLTAFLRRRRFIQRAPRQEAREAGQQDKRSRPAAAGVGEAGIAPAFVNAACLPGPNFFFDDQTSRQDQKHG